MDFEGVTVAVMNFVARAYISLLVYQFVLGTLTLASIIFWVWVIFLHKPHNKILLIFSWLLSGITLWLYVPLSFMPVSGYIAGFLMPLLLFMSLNSIVYAVITPGWVYDPERFQALQKDKKKKPA